MENVDYCSDCKRPTQVVYDHATGDSICLECGLVLESHIIDQTAEWRTFSNDDANDKDSVRVGTPSNPFLDQERTVLETTVINANRESNGQGLQIPRVALSIADKSHKSLVHGFASFKFNKTVKDLAWDIYSNVRPSTMGDDCLVAACVLIASQKLNQSRTLKEMRMATGGTS